MKTYRIIFADNTGERAADALAHEVGRWYGTVSNYNGRGHDLAFIDIDDDGYAEYIEQLMEQDDNVLSYSEVQ